MDVRTHERFERRPIDQLSPHPRNPRTHSPEQVSELAASMVEFGYTAPMLVDDGYTILSGHGRWAAARLLGLTHVPVIVLDGLSEAQKLAYVLADNQLALNADWDDGELRDALQWLREQNYDLTVVGFAPSELAKLLEAPKDDSGADPDAAPAPPELPVSRRGDLWLLGNHRVLCGDSTNAADLTRVLNGGAADAVWTDPPYNVDYEGAAGGMKNDAMPEAAFASFLAAAFGAVAAHMKAGSPIYVAHPDTGGLVFRKAFADAGFKLASCLIWRKNSLVLSRGDYHWQHEPILYGWKSGGKHRFYGGRDKTTMLEFGGAAFQQVSPTEWQIVLGETTLLIRGQDLTVVPLAGTLFFEAKPASNVAHPTMKPIALIARMLGNSTRRGHRVLDPFGGSGSTLIACESLGLKAHLVEIDERYVDVIVKRWEDYVDRSATLDGGRSFKQVAAERRPAE